MAQMAEQCSFCRKVRYYSQQGWSAWVNKVPASVRVEYFQINTCNNASCIKEAQEFIDSCVVRKLVRR